MLITCLPNDMQTFNRRVRVSVQWGEVYSVLSRPTSQCGMCVNYETHRQRFRSGSQQPSSPHKKSPLTLESDASQSSVDTALSITSTTGDSEMQGFIHGAMATRMRHLDSKRRVHVHFKSARSKQGMFLLPRARKLILESCKVQDGALTKKRKIPAKKWYTYGIDHMAAS